MNEHYFGIAYEGEDDVKYGYIDYGTLKEVMYFALTNRIEGTTVRVTLDRREVVRYTGDWEVVDWELHYELTHYEVNASWYYRAPEDDGDWGEFLTLAVFANEEQAVQYVNMLARDCTEHIAYDARLLGADLVSLDVRPAGCHSFEYSVEVEADGTINGL